MDRHSWLKEELEQRHEGAKVHGNLRNSKQSNGSEMYRVWREGLCKARKFEGAGCIVYKND